jgi:pilus assembly protein CpaC
MGKLPLVLIAALALLMPAGGRAGDPHGGSGAGPPPGVATAVAKPAQGDAAKAAPADSGHFARVAQIPPSGPPIVLQVSKGTLIRLPAPANTVFVANSDIADVTIKTPSLVYVTAKSPGQTVLYAVDAGDHVLLNSSVLVEHDLSRVRDTMRAIAPGENVNVSSVDNSLVLSGNVSNAARAEKLRSMAASIAGETKGNVVNRMTVVTPNQVNIRVKIAEVDRAALKALGVNWTKLFINSSTGLANSLGVDTLNPVTSGSITTENLISAAFGGQNGRTQVLLDALAQENLLTTLAEPNLTATNGQPASFLAGGEFPVPIAGTAAGAGGVSTITVEFKTFGVSLDVTPTILDADHLSLRIRPEVSQLTSTGAVSVPLSGTSTVTIPALTVTRAETTVQLASGQSFLLGGLIQNNTTQNISKVPWLGDIPVLGQLFRSELFQHNQTELVIVVTPYLVEPTVASLATPTDGFSAPHDAQRVMDADTYRQKLPAPAQGPIEPGGRSLIGPVGFRLD